MDYFQGGHVCVCSLCIVQRYVAKEMSESQNAAHALLAMPCALEWGHVSLERASCKGTVYAKGSPSYPKKGVPSLQITCYRTRERIFQFVHERKGLRFLRHLYICWVCFDFTALLKNFLTCL